jgi:hypothetical protein
MLAATRTSDTGMRATGTLYATPLRIAIVEVDVIAPICAWIESKNWVDFPPINWYSDDIQCIDMQKKGLKHYISAGLMSTMSGARLRATSRWS